MGQIKNPSMLKKRVVAFIWHLLFSLLLLCCAVFIVFYWWYPSPLAVAFGVSNLAFLLIGIDVILGPILTFIVFKEDKQHFLRDVLVILVIQISAFLYGLYTISEGRPVWLVFVIDDFEAVAPIDIDRRMQSVFNPEYQDSLLSRPQWVAAMYSEDAEIESQQKMEEMFDGISLARRPETYQPLINRKYQIFSRLKPFDELYKYNDKQQVDVLVKKNPEAIGWLPLKSFKKDMVVLFNKNQVQPEIVDLNPW
ncbi:MAG: TfpX/TfpZ family type IV pilin accessory protein [Moraxellaceae bacterium]